MGNMIDIEGSKFDMHTDLHGTYLKKLTSTVESQIGGQIQLLSTQSRGTGTISNDRLYWQKGHCHAGQSISMSNPKQDYDGMPAILCSAE